jgi:adenylate kinase
MARISRAIRACAAASRRSLTAASAAAPKEGAAAGVRAAAALAGRKERDREDGRRVQWVFLGCPGVGKGTYASRLSQLLDVPHIATGDLVRDALASPGPFSKQVRETASWIRLVRSMDPVHQMLIRY